MQNIDVNPLLALFPSLTPIPVLYSFADRSACSVISFTMQYMTNVHPVPSSGVLITDVLLGVVMMIITRVTDVLRMR